MALWLNLLVLLRAHSNIQIGFLLSLSLFLLAPHRLCLFNFSFIDRIAPLLLPAHFDSKQAINLSVYCAAKKTVFWCFDDWESFHLVIIILSWKTRKNERKFSQIKVDFSFFVKFTAECFSLLLIFMLSLNSFALFIFWFGKSWSGGLWIITKI